MRSYLSGLRLVSSDTVAILAGVLVCGAMVRFGLWMMDDALIAGNYGVTRLYFEYIMIGLIAVLFGLFLAASLYKIRFFNQFEAKRSAGGTFGALLSVIMIGCPACSITLASYLGLAGIIGLLPYDGIELKIAGVLILAWSLSKVLRDLKSCER